MTISKAKLQENGYLVVPGCVPDILCEAVRADINAHVGYGSGYPVPQLPNIYGGMVEMYHYQSMWHIRQYPNVYDAFAEIFGDRRLWVTIDRCCFKPPFQSAPQGYENGFIHWDLNINQDPLPFEVQGLVALTDTTVDMGGFQCVPDIYKSIPQLRQQCPNEKIPYPHMSVTHDGHAMASFGSGRVEIVPMKQGDLLIWDSALPHGNGHNRSGRSRYCMYVSMFPCPMNHPNPEAQRLRQERVRGFLRKQPPSGWAFPGDPREIEASCYGNASLTVLGRKLLGDWSWNDSGEHHPAE